MRLPTLVLVPLLLSLAGPSAHAREAGDLVLTYGPTGSVGLGLSLGLRGHVPLAKDLKLGLGYRGFAEFSGADGHEVFVGAHWNPAPSKHFRPVLGVGVDYLQVDVHEIQSGPDLHASGSGFGLYVMAGARWHFGHFVLGADGRYGAGASIERVADGEGIPLDFGQVDILVGFKF